MEIEIRMARPGDKSVHDFYNLMTSFWDQLPSMDPPELNKLDIYHTNRDEQRLVQFLMALRDEFEAIRGSILHRSPLPTVRAAFSELIAEETCLRSLLYPAAVQSFSVLLTAPRT